MDGAGERRAGAAAGWLAAGQGLYLRRSVGAQTAVLGAGSAAALAAVDLWYAGRRRRIARVYLLDAALELGLLAAWAATLRPARPRATLPVAATG